MGYDDADDEYGLFPKISEDGTFARIEQYKMENKHSSNGMSQH